MRSTLPTLPTLAAREVRLMEYEFDSRWSVPLHTHAREHELLIVTTGRMGLESADGRVAEQRGSVLLFPQEHEHECWTIGAEPLKMCCIWWEDASMPLARTVRRQQIDTFTRIEFGVQWMRQILAAQHPGWQQAAAGVLRALLHECGGTLADDSIAARVHRAQEWARTRLNTAITLDDLAEVAQMSRSHFAHEFKRLTGCSPMQFLRQARVVQATELLQSSSLPLKAIADLSGFRDAFELSRVVKRVTGRAPSTLRSEKR